MKKLLSIVIILFFFVKCSDKNKIPNGVLKKDKMQQVLWDLMKADDFVMNYVLKDSAHSIKDQSIKLYRQVFAINKTNKTEFQKSVLYYQQRPDLLKVMIDSLNNKQKAITDARSRLIEKNILQRSRSKTRGG